MYAVKRLNYKIEHKVIEIWKQLHNINTVFVDTNNLELKFIFAENLDNNTSLYSYAYLANMADAPVAIRNLYIM